MNADRPPWSGWTPVEKHALVRYLRREAADAHREPAQRITRKLDALAERRIGTATPGELQAWAAHAREHGERLDALADEAAARVDTLA